MHLENFWSLYDKLAAIALKKAQDYLSGKFSDMSDPSVMLGENEMNNGYLTIGPAGSWSAYRSARYHLAHRDIEQVIILYSKYKFSENIQDEYGKLMKPLPGYDYSYENKAILVAELYKLMQEAYEKEKVFLEN